MFWIDQPPYSTFFTQQHHLRILYILHSGIEWQGPLLWLSLGFWWMVIFRSCQWLVIHHTNLWKISMKMTCAGYWGILFPISSIISWVVYNAFSLSVAIECHNQFKLPIIPPGAYETCTRGSTFSPLFSSIIHSYLLWQSLGSRVPGSTGW